MNQQSHRQVEAVDTRFKLPTRAQVVEIRAELCRITLSLDVLATFLDACNKYGQLETAAQNGEFESGNSDAALPGGIEQYLGSGQRAHALHGLRELLKRQDELLCRLSDYTDAREAHFRSRAEDLAVAAE